MARFLFFFFDRAFPKYIYTSQNVVFYVREDFSGIVRGVKQRHVGNYCDKDKRVAKQQFLTVYIEANDLEESSLATVCKRGRK